MKNNLSMALQLVLCVCVSLLFTQGAYGNIDDFDCVGIYEQPAFQHPLLKNHKIQEQFSSYENIGGNIEYETKDHCPKGTVAILRQSNISKDVYLNTVEYPGQHFATIETMLDGSIYRGAAADISVSILKLENNQYSKSQMWLENGPRNQLNSIQVGWAVHPRLYGDSVTRLTIYWTADGYQTGCYNTICPGFVVVTRNHRLGNGFYHSSIYGQSNVLSTLRVFQDGSSGNWVVKMFNEVIGYWPKELFTHLNKGASLVRYGGNTFPSPDGFSPPMGNGHFPVDDYRVTANFEFVKIINSNYQIIDIHQTKIRQYTDYYICYRLVYWGYTKSRGVSFSYGGPGGHCDI